MTRFIAVMALAACLHAAAAIELRKTPAGDDYGYVPAPHPGSLALVLTTDIADSLSDKFTNIGAALSTEGYVVASLDLPCHGSDEPGRLHRWISRIAAGTASGTGLACWAERVGGSNEDIFAPFLASVTRVISDLQQRRLIAGTRVIAIGVSRGGYLALRLAAADSRITDVVALAPVTDLSKLREFAGHRVDAGLYGLDKYAKSLAGKRLFLQIGSNDDRVGTTALLHLSEAIVDAAGSAPIDLTVSVTPLTGHAVGEHERAAAWIRNSAPPKLIGPTAPP